MGVTHRVLYVGIGGTGVHIGKELEVALRRDLCGPDGKALIRKGGAFSKLSPYQLPDYIQSLYFDFDDDAEQILQNYELMDLMTYCDDAIGADNISDIQGRMTSVV